MFSFVLDLNSVDMLLHLSLLLFAFTIHLGSSESIQEIPPVRYVSLRTVDNSAQQKNVPVIRRGQFLIKRDTPIKPILIESAPKQILTVKTANIDEFYETKEFQDLLKEFNLTIDKRKLPNIHDIVAFLGTKDCEETLKEIREFASTDDGLELIKNYFNENNVAEDRKDNFDEPRASKFYGNFEDDADHNENSWWTKITNWFGLSQSKQLDSKKTDLEILSTVVPLSDSFHENVKMVGNFLKPAPNSEIPINPPFKVFNSQSINLSNQPYSIDVKALPAIRMTERQYNEMMKAVNLNAAKLAKASKLNKDFLVNHIDNSDIKRSFSTQSQPIRHTLYDLPTGSLYKAHPDEIDKISEILSKKSGEH